MQLCGLSVLVGRVQLPVSIWACNARLVHTRLSSRRFQAPTRPGRLKNTAVKSQASMLPWQVDMVVGESRVGSNDSDAVLEGFVVDENC